LEGDRRVVEVRGQRINICGIDDPSIGRFNFDRQLENAFDSVDSNLYTILLSHRPERFQQLSEYECDLILSGHAHGGQWRIPFILDGLIAPNQGIFPKYTSGTHTLNDTKMIVSRGLARESTRIPRVFNPPELVVIDIVPG
jgi:predicted MPP superfamily phosphohydrolase